MRRRILRGFVGGAAVAAAGLACWTGSQGALVDRLVTAMRAGQAEQVDLATQSGAASPLGSQAQARVEQAIATREYWASRTEQGIQAPNRAQNLRTWFEPTGVRVHDRTAEGSPRLVELRLAALGRGTERIEVEAGELTYHEGRVEIVRAELGLVEWLENSSAGLEQGFTLADRPYAAATASEPRAELVVDLAVEGARASLQGDRVGLATLVGRRLDYGKLAVVDAHGQTLAASFEVPREDRIRILVDDADATYPIVIDPLLTGAFDAVVESNQASSEFGVSVASAGDVDGDGYDDVIVGADLYDSGQVDEGAAFVFRGGPSGIGNGNPATAHAVLEGNQASASFGVSVASAGDVNGDGYADVIVGSYLYNAGQADEGAAFVFHGSAAGIASGGPAIANGTMESNQADARLGFSVAAAGDVNGDGYSDVVTGALAYDAPTADEGAAFVLLGSATGIGNRNPTNAHARLEGEQTEAWFGFGVGSAGDVNADGYADVIVGAPYFDFILADEGGAFLFYGGAAGIANGTIDTAQARFVSEQASSRWGESVRGAGDVNGDGYADVIIGAAFYDKGQPDEGAAFVFHGSEFGLSGLFGPLLADRILESDQTGSRFGTSVASAGDVNGDGYADVVVGAYAHDSGQADEGVAFVYMGGATGISGAPLTVQYDQASAFLGYSVASAGDVNGDGFDDVVVGAFLLNGGQADEGAALIYHGRGLGSIAVNQGSFSERLTTLQGDSGMGMSVASAGDVNGDGYDDVLIGAPFFDDGEVDEGAAFVFHGSPTGLIFGGDPSTANAVLTGNQAGSYFGGYSGSAGDINGDGFADVVVGAILFDGGEVDEGAAFVFLGSPSGVSSGSPSTAHAQLESNQPGARFGSSSAAGDVNGDGFADLLVGAPYYDNGTLDEGAAFLFHGSAAGIADGSPASAATILESNNAGGGTPTTRALFGSSVASAGDVNADGYADVIVGSSGYANGTMGAAFVFLGSASGVASAAPATAHARLESSFATARFGWQLASAGDVNGDGFADVIVGASAFANPSTGVAGYVFHGSASGIASGNQTSAQAVLTMKPAPSGFTYVDWVEVAGVGDIDGDGYADVALAFTPFDAPGFPDPTFVANGNLFRGSPSGVVSATAHASFSPSGTADLVAGAGDINADGAADVLLGGSDHAFARLGNDPIHGLGSAVANPTGRPILLRQRRGDGSGLVVQSGGASYSDTTFVVELLARSAVGRERGKIEVETCPIGWPFGAPACFRTVSPSWVDLSTSGAAISQTISGLAPNTSYSWRARILTIPFAAIQPGITPTPKESPWYRLSARATVGDIRTVPEPGVGLGLLAGALGLACAGTPCRGFRRVSRRPAGLT